MGGMANAFSENELFGNANPQRDCLLIFLNASIHGYPLILPPPLDFFRLVKYYQASDTLLNEKRQGQPMPSKDLLTLHDLSDREMLSLIEKAIDIKKNQAKYAAVLKNTTLAMLFQKTSTRTRISFEAGMTKLGGHAIYLDWRTTNLHLGSLQDEIQCIARYADIIMARVYAHSDVQTMASASCVPVINGLSDDYHPCQALADLMTIREKFGRLKGILVAYLGDGNNVCNSLVLGCAKAGMKLRVATPKGYEPKEDVVAFGKERGLLALTNDPLAAARGADVLYTDTWVSMGQEAEAKKRLRIFKGFTVTMKLLGKARFMHCLPAHRGYEVADEVMDSSQAIVFDQAENRMHAQKAVMLKLLGKL